MATTQVFSVAKSTVECYKIRSEKGPYWADVTIDAKGTSGRISISSDYGNWQNFWGACGCDFKAFLATLNPQYAADKFGAERWVDVQATLLNIREQVRELRRDETLSAEKARAIYDETKALRHESQHSLEGAIYAGCPNLGWLLAQYCISFTYEPNPLFLRFWKEIWPVLLAEFQKEAQPQPAFAMPLP